MTVVAILTVAIAALATGAAAAEPEFFEGRSPGTAAEKLASQELSAFLTCPRDSCSRKKTSAVNRATKAKTTAS